MMRRAAWLATGAALGAGGSMWARRRIDSLSERLRSGDLATDVVKVAGRGARAGGSQIRRALDAGRESARRRERQLWEDLEVRSRTG
jgi:hypothetical protein